jgi:glucose-6-phosphate 1-dehydrogenase
MFPADARDGRNEIVIDFADSFCAANSLEGYERLILDAMLDDQSLFTQAAAVERLWEISSPLLDNPPPVQPYEPGTWGPQPAVDQLTTPFRRRLPHAGPSPD